MSFAYFNQGGKQGAATRRWKRERFHELVGKGKQCAGAGCAERKVPGPGGKFCAGCLARLPDELRAQLLELAPVAGGPEWQSAFASCLSWLECHPVKGGLS